MNFQPLSFVKYLIDNIFLNFIHKKGKCIVLFYIFAELNGIWIK